MGAEDQDAHEACVKQVNTVFFSLGGFSTDLFLRRLTPVFTRTFVAMADCMGTLYVDDPDTGSSACDGTAPASRSCSLWLRSSGEQCLAHDRSTDMLAPDLVALVVGVDAVDCPILLAGAV